jgi:integrase
VEATYKGKGQGVRVVSGGLARGAGRRALTALEFQGLAAVPAEGRVNRGRDHRRRHLQSGEALEGFGAHSLRATAATNALDHEADIAKVQEWLGHANIATTRLYDRRTARRLR